MSFIHLHIDILYEHDVASVFQIHCVKEKNLSTFTACQISTQTHLYNVFIQMYITPVQQYSDSVCGFCVKVPRTVVNYVCRGKCSVVSHTFLFEREFVFVHTVCTGNTL